MLFGRLNSDVATRRGLPFERFQTGAEARVYGRKYASHRGKSQTALEDVVRLEARVYARLPLSWHVHYACVHCVSGAKIVRVSGP